MVGENLQLTLTNIARVDGYFYTINPTTDVLYKKTDDGTNAFSYPLDTNIVGPIKCLQYDGKYFWTLENNDPNIVFKKWEIEEYVLKLKNTYTLAGTVAQKYSANAFAIEHYHRTLSGTGMGGITESGSSSITVNDVARITTGDILNLGPSTNPSFVGLSEVKTVSGVLAGTNTVVLTTPITNTYNFNDTLTFSKDCWFFNKYRLNDSDQSNGSGGLYRFNIHAENYALSIVAVKNGNEFRDVVAATFLTDPKDGKDYLTFMVQTNLLFLDVDPLSTTYVDVIKSAAQNNQQINSSVIPVYAVTHEGSTLFRLQTKAAIYINGTLTDVDWGLVYNYQLSPLNRFPASIGMTAKPSVISADGSSTSQITAVVRDQFNETVNGRIVYFSENDAVGTVSGTSAITSNGIATTTYHAGTTANLVKITAQT